MYMRTRIDSAPVIF